jgi:hypothetical protein
MSYPKGAPAAKNFVDLRAKEVPGAPKVVQGLIQKAAPTEFQIDV